MKNLYLLTLMVFTGAFAFGQTSNLIISEYGEGNGGSKKYFEIANHTGAPVDLANYQLHRAQNGGAWSFVVGLSGTLADDDVYVIANNAGDVPGADLYNTNAAGFNGNDAVAIFWNGGSGSTFTILDVFGEASSDPGAGGWAVAGVAGATVDKILVRKATVCGPNTNWTSSRGTNATDSEWEIVVASYTTVAQSAATLGNSTNTCGAAPCETESTAAPVTACDSYNFYTQTLTASGDYEHVLVGANAAGCDSTINLTLTINHSTANTIEPTSCGPVTINGETYSMSGTYVQTLENVAGCDSTLTIELIVGTSFTYYEDFDEDGLGNSAVTATGCTAPDGFVSNDDDCNDDDPLIGIATITYYADIDEDGFGDPATGILSCTPIADRVLNDDDCNDSDENIHAATLWYPDTDSDGFGSAASSGVLNCVAPANHVASNTDCDDNNNARYPGATEIPDNGIDEDCNGSDLSTALGIYEFTGAAACAVLSDTVTAQPSNATFSTFTTANTVCNAAANVFNNSGWDTLSVIDLTEYNQFSIDPADCYEMDLTAISFFHKISNSGETPFIHLRSSLDNYAADVAVTQLLNSTGIDHTFTLPAAFQNISETVTFRFYITEMGATGATYRMDNVKLNGILSALPTQTYYADSDEDGFGDPAVSVTDCIMPEGYVTDNTDCNDDNAEEHPGAVWFADTDEDSFGDAASSLTQCTQPDGYVSNNTDCDDDDAEIAGQTTYYTDADGDGFGDAASIPQLSCVPLPGFADNDDDCDDDDDNVTIATETFYVDEDGDGYGEAGSTGVVLCAAPANYADNDDDCDDENEDVYPGAVDIANNGIDENCDGVDGYLAISENTLTNVSLYPNPGTSSFTVEFAGSGAYTLKMFTAEGKLVSTQDISAGTTTISAETILPGVYFISIGNGQLSATHRWIKK